MLAAASLFVLACTPNPTMRCSRTYDPVCANAVDFSNLCQAQAAGYTGECSSNISTGTCASSNLRRVPERLHCASGKVYSETGRCVDPPWDDFNSCEEEKRQGACATGNDPNPWVVEHCAVTCT